MFIKVKNAQEIMNENYDPTKIARDFKELLNVTPVGVKFHFLEDVAKDSKRPKEPLRFCQAVGRVLQTSGSIFLTKDDISCPAARVVLGFEKNDRIIADCAEKLIEAGKFTNKISALQALMDVPRIRGITHSVQLSVSDVQPDVHIFYLRPVELMQLVQAYQRVFVQPFIMNVTSITPVCGNCCVRPYVTNEICVSFGCDDSREFSGVSDDKLVLGIPFLKSVSTIRSLAEMREEHGGLANFIV